MNTPDEGRRTNRQHWDAVWDPAIRLRLPSKLNVSVLNLMRLLKRHVHPGTKYLEIGCAPGKILAWVARELRAEVSGIDYSALGVEKSRNLFESLGLEGDITCQDMFDHHLTLSSFDVVASFGVVEHFDNPELAVEQHIQLIRPGGTALITVPNYGGLYGRLQRLVDPDNLTLHNLAIMNEEGLAATVRPQSVTSVTSYSAGMVSPWLVNLHTVMPNMLAGLLSFTINAIGLVQPFSIRSLAPLLVLEVRK